MLKDLFSKQAEDYAKYRPVYPKELFDHILQFVIEKNTAWDCATGNGQAAFALAQYFKRVIATDISEKQLSLAKPHPNIKYQIASAEKTDFLDNSFDLITVAQAYHWFKFDAFEKEVKRVTEQTAAIRNKMMLDLADKVVVGFASENGNLQKMLQSYGSKMNIQYLTD